MENLAWIIVLSILFVASLLMFYFTNRIIKNNDKLFLTIKIITFLTAFACVIILLFITGE